MNTLISDLNGWFIMDSFAETPLNEPYLVYLAEDMCGSRVHVAIDHKVANGVLRSVGGVMEFDAPEILVWHPMVKLPSLKKKGEKDESICH